MTVNIAIDGPAGAGKSTIAKAAAKALGYVYVDTGALYRAVAYYCLGRGADTGDSAQVAALLPDVRPELRYENGEQRVYLNGEDVTGKIRTPEVSMGASAVSAVPAVRDFLFDLQRRIARENNVVMDGRDIGTVVLPDADVKIFLTASPEERARRRYAETDGSVPFEQVLEEVNRRDYQDSHREIAPLKQAEDGVLCDTTDVDLDGAIEMVLGIIRDKLGENGI